MRVTSGPDGYLVTDAAPDFEVQALLTDYLGERQTAGDKSLAVTLRRLKKSLPKQSQVAVIRAIHTRIAWIVELESDLADAVRCQSDLAQLARGLYAPALPFAESDLILML